MNNKYNNATITDMHTYKKRKVIRRRIRKVCVAVVLIAFFYLFGITGGVEQGLMGIKEYVVHSVATLFVMFVSIEIAKI